MISEGRNCHFLSGKTSEGSLRRALRTPQDICCRQHCVRHRAQGRATSARRVPVQHKWNSDHQAPDKTVHDSRSHCQITFNWWRRQARKGSRAFARDDPAESEPASRSSNKRDSIPECRALCSSTMIQTADRTRRLPSPLVNEDHQT